jgi:methylmalonyl-CoA mutase cobalamin-binding subunit
MTCVNAIKNAIPSWIVRLQSVGGLYADMGFPVVKLGVELESPQRAISDAIHPGVDRILLTVF